MNMTVQNLDIIESISEYLDDSMINQITTVYADKGYDSTDIREYLKKKNIANCIPKRNYKSKYNNNSDYKYYNKTRFVVERFFAWLKNDFHRTRIRYEKNCDNLSWICLSCINYDVLEDFRIS